MSIADAKKAAVEMLLSPKCKSFANMVLQNAWANRMGGTAEPPFNSVQNVVRALQNAEIIQSSGTSAYGYFTPADTHGNTITTYPTFNSSIQALVLGHEAFHLPSVAPISKYSDVDLAVAAGYQIPSNANPNDIGAMTANASSYFTSQLKANCLP
jgi:hypothetical protein